MKQERTPEYIYNLHDVYEVVKGIAGRDLTEQEYFNLNNMLYGFYIGVTLESVRTNKNPGAIVSELEEFLTKLPPFKGN